MRDNSGHGILITDSDSSIALSFCSFQSNVMGPFALQQDENMRGYVKSQGCLFGASISSDTELEKKHPWNRKLHNKGGSQGDRTVLLLPRSVNLSIITTEDSIKLEDEIKCVDDVGANSADGVIGVFEDNENDDMEIDR